MVTVLSVLHWAACAWNMGPQFADEPYGASWWGDIAGYDEDTTASVKYFASVEFSMMGMVMGYGDFSPGNPGERVLAIVLMLWAGCVYAYMIGAICAVVSEMDPAGREYHQIMDQLNMYVDQVKIKKGLKRRLRDYFTFCKQNFRERFYKEVINQMSPSLQGEVALFVAGPWIRQIKFFNCPSEQENNFFITELCLSLEPEAYAPKELIVYKGQISEKMYVIQRGIVGKEGRVLSAGQFFGEDFILTSSRRRYQVMVLTYLDVYSLSKDSLDEVLEKGDFHETSKIIRKAVLRMALRKKFLHIADMVRKKRGVRTEDQARVRKAELQAWKTEMKKKAQIWGNQAKKGLLPQLKRKLSTDLLEVTGGADKHKVEESGGDGGISAGQIREMQILMDRLADAQAKNATETAHRVNELELRVNELTDAITMGFGKIENAVKGSILSRKKGAGGPPGLPGGGL